MKSVHSFTSVLVVVLLSCALLLCYGCGNSVQDNSGRTDVIVAMETDSEPAQGFDPIYGWGDGDHVHEPLIQSTLITTDADMNFVNDLATDYSVTDDGLTWTFSIRDDVTFTNGDPLTAEDVAFTYNKIMDTPASTTDLSMMDEAVATDDYTVEFHLNKPYNAILYTIAVVGIVPKDAYDENYGSNPIGSGRYMLEQWDIGQQAILVANPDYYGEAPKMKKVTVIFYGTLANVQSGEVDLEYTSATYSQQEIDGYSIMSCKSVDSRGISIPCTESGTTKDVDDVTYDVGNDVTADLAVRQAMNYATDRTIMAENVLYGYGTPAYSVCDGMPWASSDIAFDTDIDKAKELLEESGWSDNNSDGILEKGELIASIDLYYDENDATKEALAAEFANEMMEIGIKINCYGTSWDIIYQHQFSDLILWGWGSNSPAEFYDLTYSTGWGNYASYCNDDVDALLNKAITCNDEEESNKAYQEAMEAVSINGATTWVWLENIDHLYFVRDGLHVAEQKIHPHGHGWSLLNNVDQWYWE